MRCFCAALAFVLLISSVVAVIPSSMADAGVQITNESVDDRILFNHDFENYYVGENPGIIDPIFSNHVSNPQDYGANFYVVDDGGNKELLYHKYAAGLSDWYPMLPLPTMYKQWLFEFDLNVNSLQDGSAGGTYMRITSGQNAFPGQSLVIADMLLWLTGGVYYLRYYYNSTSYDNIAISANTDLHLAFAFDDYTHSVNFTMTSSDVVIHSKDYSYYTYYTTEYPDGLQSETPSGIRFITLKNAYGQKIYFDNFKGSVQSKVVDIYPQNMLTLTFDDGVNSIYNDGYRILSENGLVGDVAIIVNRVGTSGYMNWSEFAEMYDDGWGMPSHSLSHGSLYTMPWANATVEVMDSKAFIQENITGSVVRFVCPGSLWNASLDWYARTIGYIAVPYNTPRNALYVAGGTPVSESYINNTLSWNTRGVGYYIEWHTHGVSDNAFDVSTDLLNHFILTTTEQDIRWVTGDYWANFRTLHNSFSPIIEESDDGVIIETNLSVAVPIGAKLSNLNLTSDGIVVMDRSSEELVESSVVNGEIVFWAEPGASYQIMTLSDYRSMLMTQSFEPIFVIIPFVMIVGIVSFVFGRFR